MFAPHARMIAAEEAQDDLEAPTVQARSMPRLRAVPRGPFVRGEIIGDHYSIGAPLGAGGMGFVYEAEDLRLCRRVALKVASQEAHRVRLVAEARALAAIRHPGVVMVHAMGRHDSHDFLVLERLYGRSLQSRLDECKASGRLLAMPEILALLRSIADAIGAAHAVGIAHRDIKPSNVILSGGRTVLIDFGLFVPEFDAGSRRDIIGSPEFMAPEVILREVVAGEGPYVDLYAYGILAFELLCGRTPFADTSTARVLRRHVTDVAPRVDTLRADVPSALADLVVALLERRPSDRPTMEEVSERLARWC